MKDKTVTALHWNENGIGDELLDNAQSGYEFYRASLPVMLRTIEASSSWEVKTRTKRGEYTILEFRSDHNHLAYSVVGPEILGCRAILTDLVRDFNELVSVDDEE